MAGPCSTPGREGVGPRRRWENNIKMDLTEIGWDDTY
jgi:hypothetical protein